MPARRPRPEPKVILQFTRNRRNIGKPELAPPGADDIHLQWKGELFIRAWWTKGGRRFKPIRVPRGANDAHVRIR